MGNIPILVRREIEDHTIHFVLAFLLGCIASATIHVLQDGRSRFWRPVR